VHNTKISRSTKDKLPRSGKKGGLSKMDKQYIAYIANAIKTYLNGDVQAYLTYRQKAIEIYERENHLYVSIGERLKHKGVQIC
jgi:hypothetical protein